MEIKAKVLLRVFSFGDQNTIEGVITFRIDSHTIKRGDLMVKMVIYVPLGDWIPCICIRT